MAKARVMIETPSTQHSLLFIASQTQRYLIIKHLPIPKKKARVSHIVETFCKNGSRRSPGFSATMRETLSHALFVWKTVREMSMLLVNLVHTRVGKRSTRLVTRTVLTTEMLQKSQKWPYRPKGVWAEVVRQKETQKTVTCRQNWLYYTCTQLYHALC